MAQKKLISLENLTTYNEQSLAKISQAEQNAKSYADSLASNYDPAGTAQTKVNELSAGQVTTNKNDIANLKTQKADKSTTLAGYGITDAYTKTQTYTKTETDSKISAAVANAEHLKRSIVASLPDPGDADEHTIYMVSKSSGSGNQKYDEYMLVNGAMELIGDSAVDLTNYALKSEVNTAKSEAISAAASDATTKANNALSDAKEYADGLADNYATAAQGAKADSALQQANITTGTANGTIAVKGTDVSVKGLGSAAYVATSAFDAAGTAQSKVSALENGQVATNKNDITSLKSRVATLESADTFVEASEEEILALFA